MRNRLSAPLTLATVLLLGACGTSPPPPHVVTIAGGSSSEGGAVEPVLVGVSSDGVDLQEPRTPASYDLDSPFDRAAPLPLSIRRLEETEEIVVGGRECGVGRTTFDGGGRVFSLRVLDATSEAASRFAELRVFPVREETRPDWRRAYPLRVYPDASGTVRVRIVGDEGVALIARAPGCVPVTAILDPLAGLRPRDGFLAAGLAPGDDDRTGTLWIGAGARVTGRVFDETGEPLAGAVVRMAPADTVQRMPWSFGGLTDSTDARFMSPLVRADACGEFSLRGVPVPGRIAVLAGRSRRATGRSAELLLLPDAETGRANVELLPTSDLTVRVAGAAGESLPDASISMKTPWGPRGARRTDDMPVGVWRFEGLLPGAYTVRANAEGLVGASRDVVIDDAPADVEIALVDGDVLTGRLVNSAGDPIADVEVRFAGGGTEQYARTAADGTFQLSGLPAARGVVQIFQPAGHRSYLRRGVSVADGPLEITLESLSSIRGRLDPVPACGKLTYIGPGGARSGWKTRTIDVAADGSFVIEGIDGVRPFDLLLWPVDGACHLLRGTRLVPGETLDVGVLDGSPAARLNGRVLDADAQPIAGATVYFEQFPVAQRVRVRTGADGRFVLPFNARGPGLLVVESENRPRTHFALRADPERTSVEFLIRNGGTVAGTLPESKPGARHSAYVEFRRKGAPGRWTAKAESGLGAFELRLPAGDYTSRVWVDGGWVAGEDVAVTEGGTCVVKLGGR